MDDDRVELAPLSKKAKMTALATALIAATALAVVSFGGLGENLIFYWSPSEMKQAGEKAFGATIRLGGQVLAGTVVRTAGGSSLKFEVGDGEVRYPVDAQGMPPAMFREGIGVVLEGTLQRSGRFEARRLMVKHDNEYRAPGEGDADTKKLMKTTEGLVGK
jgi:cytochrome c-type biogenesis protein CcmE